MGLMSALTGPPINITFELMQQMFFPNQPVSGNLVLEVNSPSPVPAEKVTVRLCGEEYCHWTEGSGDDQQTHSARRVIVDQTVVVWGGGGQALQPGQGRIQFGVMLPGGSPPSWQKGDGYIKYTLTANVDIKMGRDKSAELIIPVGLEPQGLIGLTSSMPRANASTKSVGCLCCAAGNIEAAISIPPEVMPYMSHNSAIEVAVHGENKSTRSATCVVQLVEITMYHASTKTRTDSRVVARIPLPNRNLAPHTSVDAKVTLAWDGNPPRNTLLTIPGHICNVSYVAKFVVDPSWSVSFSANLPLVIGPLDIVVGAPGASGVPQPQPQQMMGGGMPPPQQQQPQMVGAGGSPAQLAPFGAPQQQAGDAQFEELISKLREPGGEKAQIVRQWLSSHPGCKPSPDQVRGAVSQTFSLAQAEVSGALAQGISGFTCAHAAGALEALSFSAKRDALKAMAPYITDKEQNKHILIDGASMLDQDDYRKILA